MIDLAFFWEKLTNYALEIITFKKLLLFYLIFLSFFGSLLISIPVKSAIANIQYPQPQAILILGGSHQREIFTAQFAHLYPQIPIWLSSGSNNNISRQIFHDAGINLNRLHLDSRATDTVTNFTTLVKEFQKQNIKHIYVVTSGYHISRASAIATIVLGSKGIAFSPISVPETREPESLFKTIRDTTRAILWVITGYTGAKLKNDNVVLIN